MLDEVFTFNKEETNEHWLMVDIPKEKSGLSRTIFAITYKCIDDMFGPRIRVPEHCDPIINTSDLKSIFYFDKIVENKNELSEELFLEMKKFIILNQNILWRFWLGKISGAELLDNIQKE